MKQSSEVLIQQLTQELKPQRFWLPQKRALVWGAAAVVLNTLAFVAYQAFRPGAFADIFTHPRFLVELTSITVFGCLLIYSVFCWMVPGRKVEKPVALAGLVSFLVFAVSIYISFEHITPKATVSGARAFCVEEVLLYGLFGYFSFLFFVRKNEFPFSRKAYFASAFVATLVPGTLMQLACMYSPKHALLLHYMPALVLALLVAGIGALIKFIKQAV